MCCKVHLLGSNLDSGTYQRCDFGQAISSLWLSGGIVKTSICISQNRLGYADVTNELQPQWTNTSKFISCPQKWQMSSMPWFIDPAGILHVASLCLHNYQGCLGRELAHRASYTGFQMLLLGSDTPNTFIHILLTKASHITLSEFKGIWKMVEDFSNACSTISVMMLEIQ